MVLLLLAGCCTAGTGPRREAKRPIVVLLTDFGTRGDAVSLMRGAILSIARDAQVEDLTHEIAPFDIEGGARSLEDAPAAYPEGTVFVAVVDPGVGTSREPIAVALANGRFLVGPDNGLLALAMERYGVRSVRAIHDPRFLGERVSATFHGRDVFAPSGAHVAIGDPPFESIGPEVGSWRRLATRPVTFRAGPSPRLDAAVAAIDEPFGNVWTDIAEVDLAKLGPVTRLAVTLGDPPRTLEVPLARTFGDVPEGKPLAYWSSRGRLALALNQGDAARAWNVRPRAPVSVSAAKP